MTKKSNKQKKSRRSKIAICFHEELGIVIYFFIFRLRKFSQADKIDEVMQFAPDVK